MKLIKKSIFILLVSFGCSQQPNEPTFHGNSNVIGQWHTNDKNWPHWLMFDSLNNFYRWSFNEQIPSEPTAKFIATDSTIKFIYPPDSVEQEFILQVFEYNKLTILPPDDRIMSTYIYQRDSFSSPRFAEIYILRLTETEADSLQEAIPNYQAAEDSIFEDAFYLLEHSWINYQLVDSTSVTLKNGTSFNKFDFGGYGIIYFTNDSTYIREGFPERSQFQAEIDSFFHFVNRIHSLND
ncbi:hypothetical protein [Marinoscillum sp. MHG1-6]|uniref:hypothetical protein n=1 Tax=Marinoscillum sp. MHG1-6 TaxID=2959627 RepID=UPI0021579F57|nr:hypothetical protein [Marinoscillum sp. MHG1-6]